MLEFEFEIDPKTVSYKVALLKVDLDLAVLENNRIRRNNFVNIR